MSFEQFFQQFFSSWLGIVFLFLLGTFLTSFFMLCIERLPHQMGWRKDADRTLTIAWPPSRCNACKKRIPLPFLFPILGFLLSLGRCPFCGMRIPWRYPLFEFLGGLVFALIPLGVMMCNP